MKLSLVACALQLGFAALACAADWPQWRGPERTGVSQETGLLQEWPESGPGLRWKAEIGGGYSSPAVVAGRVFLQTTQDNDEFAVALDEKTGQALWQAAIGKVGKNRGPQYPGTRSTPTLDGDRLYCLASDGELVCLEKADGKVHWRRHLKTDFEGRDGNWAYSESVLIDGNTLVCTPGGAVAALAALDKSTGDVLWKSVVPDGDNAEYASIMIVGTGAAKQYVTFLRKGVVGVDAATGKFLWRYDHTIDPGANIMTPIVVGDRVFSSGSRTGGGLIELHKTDDGISATELYFSKNLGSGIGGVVLVDGNLYGTTNSVMFCAEFATGKVLWTDRGVGPASICYADHRLYVRGHTSDAMALVEATPAGYSEKGRFQQPDRAKSPAWPHPVVANGGLYLRDQGNLLCYQVGSAK